jgi:catalase
VSGPRRGVRASEADAAVHKQKATDELAAAFPFNRNKPAEFEEDARKARPGATAEPADASVTASTLSETATRSAKADGAASPGVNPANAPLTRERVDSGGRVLTTNFGVPVSDNQDSLKLGARGPALWEDFVLREKITHFDHERIPERIVHARGSAAHGFFECYDSLARYTRASFLGGKGKRTPVFVRFSTVAGERGSLDTPRDVRGFATKFYTDEGNFDIVGNNIPVFFIQDAIKFPDLVHALKPEPHHAMPQAASAHDTFWDFVSLMPESTHMLMWVMSDRALPRSFRTWPRSTTTRVTASTGRRSIADASPTSPTRWPAAVPSRRARGASPPSRSRSRRRRCGPSPRSSRTTTPRPRSSGTARLRGRRRTSSAASASS